MLKPTVALPCSSTACASVIDLPPQIKYTSMRQNLSQSILVSKASSNDDPVKVVVHEFESLLFSKPEMFKIWFDDERMISKLLKIRNEFESPEHINGGYNTAPSRRIIQAVNTKKLLMA